MVVDAGGHDIDILTDAFGTGGKRGNRCRCEADVAIPHEQVIPLDPERPVWSETIFPAYTGHSAPACFASGVEDGVRNGDNTVISVVCYGGATLQVDKGVLPGTTIAYWPVKRPMASVLDAFVMNPDNLL